MSRLEHSAEENRWVHQLQLHAPLHRPTAHQQQSSQATGIQLVRAIGIKKLIPILAVGGLALGLLASRNTQGDEAEAPSAPALGSSRSADPTASSLEARVAALEAAVAELRDQLLG